MAVTVEGIVIDPKEEGAMEVPTTILNIEELITVSPLIKVTWLSDEQAKNEAGPKYNNVGV